MLGIKQLTPPTLLLIFNRPETTARVFERIRMAQPAQLYVAADGPREGVVGEPDRCAEARRVATQVDWDCETKTLFRPRNLGCGLAVSGAIAWFFENVKEGIILEDDCVPDPSFFRFCQELLLRYSDEKRVMHVSGNSHQYGRRRGSASYYFSKYPNIWGWASWRRAWQYYDFNLRPSWQLQDTWDTQWVLSVQKAGGVTIVPNANLVKNIGFGPGGTHTRAGERPAGLEAQAMTFPLVHPKGIRIDRDADTFTYYVHHRMVRHLRLIWLYQLLDSFRAAAKAIKGWMRAQLL